MGVAVVKPPASVRRLDPSAERVDAVEPVGRALAAVPAHVAVQPENRSAAVAQALADRRPGPGEAERPQGSIAWRPEGKPEAAAVGRLAKEEEEAGNLGEAGPC